MASKQSVATAEILSRVRACTICEAHLPLGCRPLLQLDPRAKILVVGQAPGRKAHDSGRPFDDASGVRLREWLGVPVDTFYNPGKIALLPMGFCYPGSGKSGDLPPRKECELTWRSPLLAQLPDIEMTLVLGKYAQDYHFGRSNISLTELVKSWQSHWPDKVPLPHPSPRNNIWLRRNPWFESELLPPLRRAISRLLGGSAG